MREPGIEASQPVAARGLHDCIQGRRPFSPSARLMKLVRARLARGDRCTSRAFPISIKPVDLERALALLGQEVEAARTQGMEARLLVPLTRPQGGPALQYELVLPNLDAFEASARRGWAGR